MENKSFMVLVPDTLGHFRPKVSLGSFRGCFRNALATLRLTMTSEVSRRFQGRRSPSPSSSEIDLEVAEVIVPVAAHVDAVDGDDMFCCGMPRPLAYGVVGSH